jgi:hypothetical protein
MSLRPSARLAVSLREAAVVAGRPAITTLSSPFSHWTATAFPPS